LRPFKDLPEFSPVITEYCQATSQHGSLRGGLLWYTAPLSLMPSRLIGVLEYSHASAYRTSFFTSCPSVDSSLCVAPSAMGSSASEASSSALCDSAGPSLRRCPWRDCRSDSDCSSSSVT
jgi:hypothetical protein